MTGPVRTCIGCRARATKSELLRVTAGSGSDGRPAVVPDPGGTAPGRGAHLHPTTGCYDLAVRRKAFSRALRIAPGAGGLSSVPVGEYVADLAATARTDPTDRDWSNSS
ncbi:YlxR family protein [Nocardioides daeguensis]|uniref:YlxR domain-containing protein n=1 Tax=Nocardioides daeguensis TaxID=908359 RepID=A0ABP6UX05_9ACTN|nr:YlxR family protein [Nocardioides daeguensis]MBV6725810.1 YlxR family protein [Nocardioides daeguensis]MCR1772675.1 YlxR family protein [Nocardioides daeguensis]